MVPESAMVDGKVDCMTTIERFRGAIYKLQEHNQAISRSLDVHIIEDRINKVYVLYIHIYNGHNNP